MAYNPELIKNELALLADRYRNMPTDGHAIPDTDYMLEKAIIMIDHLENRLKKAGLSGVAPVQDSADDCPCNQDDQRCRHMEACTARKRIADLEEALMLMVYQYCVTNGKLDHRFMCAGEHAFTALGLENGDSVEKLEEMWKL